MPKGRYPQSATFWVGAMFATLLVVAACWWMARLWWRPVGFEAAVVTTVEAPGSVELAKVSAPDTLRIGGPAWVEQDPPDEEVSPPFDWTTLGPDQVRPGDRLRFNWGDDLNVASIYTVDRNGDLKLRLRGQRLRVRAAGLRLEEIRARLEALRRKHATSRGGEVAITGWQRMKLSVMVIGEVFQPGSLSYDLREGLTVGEAIAQAGGPRETAESAKVSVTRTNPEGDPVVIEVNLIFDDERGTGRRLQPDDIVFVPARPL